MNKVADREDRTSSDSGPVPADAVSGLVASAARWIGDALRAWSDDDFAKVAVLAPLAVEHLGKAVLWEKNPVLLSPLDQASEASFLALANKPDILNPQLRTIGLSVLLGRLEKVAGLTPLEQKRRRRMIDVRNGGVHVGTSEQSRYVLLDCLALCEQLLRSLGESPRAFYDEHYSAVQVLLDSKRNEVAHQVAAKMTRARRRLSSIEEQLGTSEFKETTKRLEAQVDHEYTPKDFGSTSLWAATQECPCCGASARLFGDMDATEHPDFDVESISGGGYESVLVGTYWELLYTPQAFACNVCKLELHGTDELGEARLPSTRFDIEAHRLGEWDVEIDFAGFED